MTFVQASKQSTMHTLSSIQLMSNCGVEIYGLDFNSSYQHVFVYIRQLAIHLRNAIMLKSKVLECLFLSSYRPVIVSHA